MELPPAASPCRAWLADLGRDLGFALRSLRRTPTFTMVTLASLGFGLAVVAVTLAIANAYLIRGLPYPEGKRLYHVMYAPPGPYEPRGMTALDWSSVSDVVDATLTTGGDGYFIGEGGTLQFVRATRVSPGFIEGLGVRPAAGRVFSAEDYQSGGPAVALLGHGLWRERFNSDPTLVGREIRVTPENQSSSPHLIRIVGVLPPGFWFGRTSGSPIEMLVPLRAPARTYMVRLREGVPVALAEQRITQAARAVGSDFRPGWAGVRLESAHDRYVAGLRPLLLGINTATTLLFVLVAANVAILILLRALRRQKEVAVRIALGAEPRHLGRLLMAEAGLLCAGALLLGLAASAAALRMLGPIIEARLGRPPPGGPAAISIDASVGLMVGGIGLLAALLLTLVPLLASRRRQLAENLRRNGAGATDGPATSRLRSMLIALEVAGALVLLVSGGLMIRSLLNLVRTDLGFDAGRVVRTGVVLPGTYREPESLAHFWEKLGERLAAVTPLSALGSSFPPFYESHKRPFRSDADEAAELSIGGLTVGANYFAVHGIEVRQGREFTLNDRFGREPVAVVSDTLARQLWPGESAIGRRIRGVEESVPDAPLGPWRTVVGVVRDVRQTYDDYDLRDVYFPFLQSPTRFGSVQIRTDRIGAVPPSRIAAVVAEFDAFARVGAPSLLAAEDQQMARASFMTALLGAFAGTAVLLALLGIYGVTAYAVRQREREVAIRIAVGATHGAIVRLFLRQGGTVIVAGVLAGLVATLAAGRILENQIHGVERFDPITLIAAGTFLAACALLATWWPVRRTAKADLLLVLKEE